MDKSTDYFVVLRCMCREILILAQGIKNPERTRLVEKQNGKEASRG